MNNIKLSRFLSMILRHKPEAIGLTLDRHGWANVDELIEKTNASGKHRIDFELLEAIVAEDDKQRYSFNDDRTMIRANQGHSIHVDVELEQKTPPAILYHGTGEKYTQSIDSSGLIPKSRLYVHLSPDVQTAQKVGERHGRCVIYSVNAEQMTSDGFVFYESVNHVWLTNIVPVEYLVKLDGYSD